MKAVIFVVRLTKGRKRYAVMEYVSNVYYRPIQGSQRVQTLEAALAFCEERGLHIEKIEK